MGDKDSECRLRRHTVLSIAAMWAGDGTVAAVCAVTVLLSMPDRIDGRRSIERPARFSWRRLVLPRGWSNGESDGGDLEEKGDFLPLSFLAFPLSCRAQLCLPALSWLGFDLGAGRCRGQGLWLHCALYTCIQAYRHTTYLTTLQCNLRMRESAPVRCWRALRARQGHAGVAALV